jgi:hypothetical protein
VSSLVRDFQRDIVQSSKSTTELLQTAKLIAVKLGLQDITEWIDAELIGYNGGVPQVPEYRWVSGGDLVVRNPARGWEPVGPVNNPFKIGQPVPEIEALQASPSVFIPLARSAHYPVIDIIGNDRTDWQQQVQLSKGALDGLLSGVKDRLFDWSLELSNRGIVGESMVFVERERQSAQQQMFKIQNMTGIVDNASHSGVQIYDYSSLHKVLKQQNISQQDRNELENIMDELKTADPETKKGLLEQGKAWVVKNEEFLGASAELVRKALGLEGGSGALQ